MFVRDRMEISTCVARRREERLLRMRKTEDIAGEEAGEEGGERKEERRRGIEAGEWVRVDCDWPREPGRRQMADGD
jgi:hypothetical protein